MHNWVFKDACSGMFSDELDKMGFPQQVITGLIPNNSNLKFYSRIRTLSLEITESKDEDLIEGLTFLESLSPGEIICVESSTKHAYFGELMSKIATRQKLAGVIIGGVTRDRAYTQNLTDLLIFAQGFSPQDMKGRGRVQGTDVPIKIKGVPINPGDWAFGDIDGVVIIPENIRLELEQRIIKTIKEEISITKAIETGITIGELLKTHEVF
jgi:4-hydroxy-4-methyl-2-oxoglutarate aldolase